MKKYIEVQYLLNAYKEEAYFTSGVSNLVIRKVEKELGVTFPISYKWFLKHYGDASVFGTSIYECL